MAHPPHEYVAGQFRRGDGQTVLVVRHYVDGIFFADPVSVQFRLADGKDIAHTGYSTDAVVRDASSGQLVYQFVSVWFPIASRVQRFDGYSLTEITTASRRLISPLVHTLSHWIGYVSSLGIWGVLFLIWRASQSLPRRGWLAGLRILGFSFVALVGALSMLFLLYAPISTPLLLLLGLGIAKVSRTVRKSTAPTVPKAEAGAGASGQ